MSINRIDKYNVVYTYKNKIAIKNNEVYIGYMVQPWHYAKSWNKPDTMVQILLRFHL